MRIGDLVGTVIDKFCQVSIDIIIPDTLNLQSVYEGPIGDAPEICLNAHFRPIEIVADYEDRIHLIVN